MKIPSLALPLPLILSVLSVLSGCNQNERVNTNTVLANSNCKAVTEGITQVTLAEVATFRGSKLIGTADLTEPPGEAPLFISISRGVQQTRGFELHLAEQALVTKADELQVPIFWSEPNLSKAQPLTSTHPCLVVSVPDRGWSRIEAVDQKGVSLGALVFPATTTAPN